jgi:hypothetical protein
LKIDKTAVTQTASGFEQVISYQVGEKIRREIFADFTRERLHKTIEDRRRELERQ